MSFHDSYLGRLRQRIGSELVLMPGVRCVLADPGGRILLQRRSDFGVWGLPGGNAEPGESLLDVAIREVREEVGVDVPVMAPYGCASDPAFETITFPNGDRCQFVSLMFWAATDGTGAHAASDETLEAAWFDPAALPDDMLANMRRSVEAFVRFQATGSFQMI